MEKHKLLEDVINSSLCGQLDLMFGKGSYVNITFLGYVQSKKKYMAHVKLFIENVDEGMIFYPDGLESVVRLGWKVINRKNKLMILPSIDIKN